MIRRGGTGVRKPARVGGMEGRHLREKEKERHFEYL